MRKSFIPFVFFILNSLPSLHAQNIGESIALEVLSILERQITREDSIKDKIDHLLFALEKKYAPGASIAVLQKGKIVYSNSFGEANLEYEIPITSKTIFHVASVSKQFTAFAIAMLIDQGKISLYQDVRLYLPELPDFGSEISINHLLHHTSGLRDQWELLVLAGWRPDDVITEEHLLKLITNQRALNFTPGDEFQYSNTNYTLLAKIVERVTGIKFTDWTKQHIFEPLHMDHSFFYDDHEKIVKNRAYSYSENNNGYKKKVLNYSNVGATSLFTTAEDLTLWANNFEDIKVGNSVIMDLMKQTAVLNNGKTIDYAFGQELSHYKGIPIFVHGGADAGYRSYLVRFPEQQFAVAVLSNLASFDTKRLAMQVVDLCLEEDIASHLETSEYAGLYEIQPGIVLKVWLDSETLKAQITGKHDVHNLIPLGQEQYKILTLDAQISFNRDQHNKVYQLTMVKGGRTMTADKQIEAEDSAIDLSVSADEIVITNETLNDYQGQYEIDKPLLLSIWLENDTLRARVTGKNKNHVLVPLSNSTFDVPSLNATIQFNVDSTGKTTKLTFFKEGKSNVLPKLEMVHTITELDMSEYVGKYYSEELSTFYFFALEGNKIVAKHQRNSDIPLKVIDPDYLTSNWFFKEIRVIRDIDENVVGLKISSNRTRDLWFEKIE